MRCALCVMRWDAFCVMRCALGKCLMCYALCVDSLVIDKAIGFGYDTIPLASCRSDNTQDISPTHSAQRKTHPRQRTPHLCPLTAPNQTHPGWNAAPTGPIPNIP